MSTDTKIKTETGVQSLVGLSAWKTGQGQQFMLDTACPADDFQDKKRFYFKLISGYIKVCSNQAGSVIKNRYSPPNALNVAGLVYEYVA